MRRTIAFFLTIYLSFLVSAVPIYAQNGFFKSSDEFFKKTVANGAVDYAQIHRDQKELNAFIAEIEEFSFEEMEQNKQKAFLINAYNILAIATVVKHYPVSSPLKVSGFFTEEIFSVAGQKVSLDDLEKEWLMKEFPDARLHFILVCAAKGCPEIVPNAYMPQNLDQQIEKRTVEVLSDPNFVKIDSAAKVVELSEIFNWYESDFKKADGSVEEYVKQFSKFTFPDSYRWTRYPYDWSLNKKKVDSEEVNSSQTLSEEETPLQLYTSSVLYNKGEYEVKWLNNFYTQNTFFDSENVRQPVDRATYLTSFFQFTAGVHPRVNVGLDFIFKSVHQSANRGASPARVLRFQNNANAQTKLTYIGPRIKFIPFKNLSRLSVQSTFYIPTARDMEGSGNGRPFLEYDKFFWWTQFFFDQRKGSILNHFFGLDLIGRLAWKSNLSNRLETPVTYILSAFPLPKFTVYGLGQWYPGFQKDANGQFGLSQYFIQVGLGTKVYVRENLELELAFNHFLYGRDAGAGEVVNLGLRYVIW